MLIDLVSHGHGVRLLTLPKGRLGLHCMATGAGYERRADEAYAWDGLQRGPAPFLVIQHTLAGRGELEFAGARQSVGPGETMVLSFPHANRYWLERGGSWEYFWVVLNGREGLRIARAVIDAAGPVLRLPGGAIDRLASQCLALLRGEAMLPGEVSAAAYGAVMALHDGVFGTPEPDAQAAPQAVARVRTFIEHHLAERLDIDRLARSAQLSRAHFVRVFAAATGLAPSAYVFATRMERAARLLVATDGPVAEIAGACGFADANYFAKAFRRHFSVSPSQYRAAGTGSPPAPR